MNRLDIQNGWEFYVAYRSTSRHVMSKNKGWKYDMFRNGLLTNINESKFTQSRALITLWSDLSAEVLEIYPSINRMDILRAFAMTFFNNNNKFYLNKYSGADVIKNYGIYKDLINNSKSVFVDDLKTLTDAYKAEGLTMKQGLSKIGQDDLPDIMYRLYRDEISLTTLYALNNLYKASNPANLSLITYLRNVDSQNIFLKMFAKNIDMWELIFAFDYKLLGMVYLKIYNDHNNSI